ncbi:MAG: sulfite exporter TauE/SafE family protein [Clostridia bacterium]|nr:sulfite exporter TauE/SafE family protein [Clostridia bacterium]
MIRFIATIFIAAMVQGMSGFGFSLVAMPFLAMVMPLKVLVPILVICSLALNIIIFSKMTGKVHLKRITVLLIVGALSTPLGVQVLTVIDERLLRGVVGSLVFFSALIMLRGVHVHFKNKQLTYAITGFLSGVLNGSVSLSGPPVVLMLVNEGEEKNDFKKNISGYFLALNIFTIPSFFFKGLIDVYVMKMSAIGIIVLLIGATIGIRLGDRIDEKKFKMIVLFMIMIMGLMTITSIF